MKFVPRTEAEIAIDGLLPVGVYDFRAIDAQDKVSAAGNDMIMVTLAVYKPDGGFLTVTDYLMEKIAYKLRHFCEETGIINLYENGTLMASDLLDREGKVQIVIDPERTDKESGKVYRSKNSVKDYGGKGAKAPAAGAAPAAVNASGDEDGIPF